MLIGQYSHIIDDKKRISLPIKFRKELGKKIIITTGLDNCLFIFTNSEWLNISNEISRVSFLNNESRSFNRFLLGSAMEVEVDSNGRILIPTHLLDFAGISKDVVFVGVNKRLEVWSSERWQKIKEEVTQNANSLAEKLSHIGAI